MKKTIILAGALFIATCSNVIAQDHSVDGDWEINVDHNNNDPLNDKFWVSYGSARKNLFEVNPEKIKFELDGYNLTASKGDFTSKGSASFTVHVDRNSNDPNIDTFKVIYGTNKDDILLDLGKNKTELSTKRFTSTTRDSFEVTIDDNENDARYDTFKVLYGRNKEEILTAGKNGVIINEETNLNKGFSVNGNANFKKNFIVNGNANFKKDFSVKNGPKKLLVVDNSRVETELDIYSNRLITGNVLANKVILSVGSFPDYVFSKSYNLMPLNEVNSFIKKYKHLPNMKSEKEVVKEGMELKEITLKLVEKVEELTLYTIQQQQLIENLQTKLTTLKK
ncbi:hypothetical protein [Tenacibaculum halocynthiae]|uniref:hypothetical protein n=1 Tax=Tenacibaculum halocynthiae TaxID=1254437 RepID=UPI003D646C34